MLIFSLIGVGLSAYALGYWTRGKYQKRRVEWRTLDDADMDVMREAFGHMDKAFATMDEVFKSKNPANCPHGREWDECPVCCH